MTPKNRNAVRDHITARSSIRFTIKMKIKFWENWGFILDAPWRPQIAHWVTLELFLKSSFSVGTSSHVLWQLVVCRTTSFCSTS